MKNIERVKEAKTLSRLVIGSLPRPKVVRSKKVYSRKQKNTKE